MRTCHFSRRKNILKKKAFSPSIPPPSKAFKIDLNGKSDCMQDEVVPVALTAKN